MMKIKFFQPVSTDEDAGFAIIEIGYILDKKWLIVNAEKKK